MGKVTDGTECTTFDMEREERPVSPLIIVRGFGRNGEP
jgi:hypothetical protein